MKSFKKTRACSLAILAVVGAALVRPVHAERPMLVDDAGATAPGTAKIQLGWSRDDRLRGWDVSAGYAVLANVEIELAAQSLRRPRQGDEPESLARQRATGLALKWVPLAQDTGLSAGIKLDLQRARQHFYDDAATQSESTRALNALASWRFEQGPAVHLNLGCKWVRGQGVHAAANTWGVGYEHPLGSSVQVGIEWLGEERLRPDKQIGLRWEVCPGVKLSAAVGQGNARRFGNAGLAWEF